MPLFKYPLTHANEIGNGRTLKRINPSLYCACFFVLECNNVSGQEVARDLIQNDFSQTQKHFWTLAMLNMSESSKPDHLEKWQGQRYA